MARLSASRAAALAVTLAVGLALGGAGCDGDTAKIEAAPAAKTDERRAWRPLEPTTLTAPPAELERPLDADEPSTSARCHDVFAPGGQALATLPLDGAQLAAVAATCELEALVDAGDGDDARRYLAWGVPRKGPGWDLQIASYGADGGLRWTHTMGRGENAENFLANFRESFIAPLLPRLVCYGTLWQGSVRLACLDDATGEPEFNGRLKLWAAISPQPLDHALHTADINGITRRYPYTGVEMRFAPLPGDGGRAAVYATDGRRLFYAPHDGAPAQIGAWDFASMKPLWRLALPERPVGSFDARAFASHNLLVFKLGQTLHGVDTASGEQLWAAEVGDDQPPMATDAARLYLLLRRSGQPNLLYALEPRTGRVIWWSEAPTGTLSVRHLEDTLLIESVRTVRRVHLPTDDDGRPDPAR